MGSTILVIAVFLFSAYVSNAHWHRFPRPDFLRKECEQATNNDTAQANSCVRCFNESRIEPTPQEDELESEPEDRFGRHPRPGFGFGLNRLNFNATKLDECVRTYLGANYADCNISPNQNATKIESLRILQCVQHRFSEIIGRQCASEVKNDDLQEFFTCQRDGFFKG